ARRDAVTAAGSSEGFRVALILLPRPRSGGQPHALAQEAGAALDDAPLLVGGQLGVDRQGPGRPGRPPRRREGAPRGTEGGPTLPLVQGQGVVDLAADVFGLEVADEGVALAVGDADDVLVEAVPAVGPHGRPLQEVAQVVLLQERVVAAGGGLAGGDPVLQ